MPSTSTGGPSTQLVVKLPARALSLPGGGVPNALVVAPRQEVADSAWSGKNHDDFAVQDEDSESRESGLCRSQLYEEIDVCAGTSHALGH